MTQLNLDRNNALVRYLSVVYMARDVIILIREDLFRGPLEGVGPEKRDFLDLEMTTSEASAIWVQKAEIFQGPPLPIVRVMDLPP